MAFKRKQHLPNNKTFEDLLADPDVWDLPEDECQYVDTKYIGKTEVEYEIFFGSEKIVFIKTGAGGSVRGRNNKYMQMAQKIYERTGATVICSSNPDIPHEALDEEEIC